MTTESTISASLTADEWEDIIDELSVYDGCYIDLIEKIKSQVYQPEIKLPDIQAQYQTYDL